ncbi:MAG TPA: hypothetical protein VGL15_14195 [Vicinamibacteria bacterium]|jgi:hypothetical protein
MTGAARCPLCRERKGRRPCPAKGAHICSHCCGTRRRVEIACPDDCVYLGAHAAGWEGRTTERRRDARRLASHLQPLDERQRELFFLALVGLGSLRSRLRMDDQLLVSACAAVRKTLQTRSSGILYEHAPEDPAAQRLVPELEAIFETETADGRTVRPAEGDLVAVLGALERCASALSAEGEGPSAFLETAARIVGDAGLEPAPAPPLLVLP